jgi:DNA-binding GntR family transcriptional regulator
MHKVCQVRTVHEAGGVMNLGVLWAVAAREDLILTAITGQPAYQQVATDLRRKIANGTYGVGDALPSTAKLMEAYNCSITVVRAAIRELQVEGLLIGQPGKGVYVQRVPDEAVPSGDLAAQVATLAATVRDLDARVTRLEKSDGRKRP